MKEKNDAYIAEVKGEVSKIMGENEGLASPDKRLQQADFQEEDSNAEEYDIMWNGSVVHNLITVSNISDGNTAKTETLFS